MPSPVFLAVLLLAFVPPAPAPSGPQGVPASVTPPTPPSGEAEQFEVERGALEPPLLVPRNEKLVYGVYVGFGIGRLKAGTISLETGIEPYRESLLLLAEPEDGAGEVVWMRSTAVGAYGFFQMDQTIETRHFPSDWPQISMLTEHMGQNHKRRELTIGLLDGHPVSRYRRDTEDGAPKGTRIWQKAKDREVPEHTLDMLSAIYLSRTLIRDQREELSFPLVDNVYLWEMRLRRGSRVVQETPVGTFEAVELLLEPKPHPTESEEQVKKHKKKFEGLFRLRGAIHMWVDEKTGIPVRVQGDLPIGFLELRIDAVLEEHRGTPSAFRPLEALGRRDVDK